MMASQSRRSSKGQNDEKATPTKSGAARSQAVSPKEGSPSGSLKERKQPVNPKENSSRSADDKTRNKISPEPPSAKQSRESQRKSVNHSQERTSVSGHDDGRRESKDNKSVVKSHKTPSRETKNESNALSDAGKRSTSGRSKTESLARLSDADTGSRIVTDANSLGTASLKDSSILNYSDIDFRAFDFEKPVLNARAVLHVGPESCSCYPKTSSRNVPSMMYDQVRCVHHGNLAYPHEGVSNFDDGWNVMHEQDLRPKTQKLEDKGYFRGYPQPLFDQIKESRRSSRISENLRGLKSVSQYSVKDDQHGSSISTGKASVQAGSSSKKDLSEPNSRQSLSQKDPTNIKQITSSQKDLSKPDSETKSQQSKGNEPDSKSGSKRNLDTESDGQGTRSGSIKDSFPEDSHPEDPKQLSPSQRWNMKLPRTPDSRPTTKDIQALNLPKIGRSAVSQKRLSSPPSVVSETTGKISENHRKLSNSSEDRTDRKAVTMFTPIEEGHGTTHRNSNLSPEKLTPKDDINKNRTFKGKYYDPVTDQVYSYEVTHEFGKHINRWPSKREGCKSN